MRPAENPIQTNIYTAPMGCTCEITGLILRGHMMEILDYLRQGKLRNAQCARCGAYYEISIGDCCTVTSKRRVHPH